MHGRLLFSLQYNPNHMQCKYFKRLQQLDNFNSIGSVTGVQNNSPVFT